MNRFFHAIIVAVIYILVANPVFANMRIVITDGVNQARPIAIAPFKWIGNGFKPENIEEIIENDLRNSGQFSPISAAKMPQLPKSLAEVVPEQWEQSGADSVVIGSIQDAGSGKYLISYQLIDVLNDSPEVLATNQFMVTSKGLRYAAHNVSDEVFEKLTGVKGAFRTKIAYIVKVKTGQNSLSYELRVSDYDGFNEIILHRASEPLMTPSWSPDGNQIAFVSFETGRSALMLKTLSTGRVEQLLSYTGHNGAPAFSPDGKRLVFSSSRTGNLNLYMMDIGTRNVYQLTNGRSNDTEPTWLPDSQTIVYTSDQAGRPQLYSININERAPKRLTWKGRQNQNPMASSDGSFVIMISTDDARQQNVSRLDLSNGGLSRLTSTFLDETPSVSPNGMMVIYSSTERLKNVLNLVSADGRFKAKLPAGDGDLKFPAWSPYL